MVDNLTKYQRSYIMSKIKCKKTRPELALMKKLEGFIYQPKTFGNPDFINYKKMTVIFVDGCFWHKCPLHYKEPQSNKEYWKKKIQRNILRDQEINLNYKNSNWKIFRIWEHDII